jgi:hypothetical protein
VGESFEALAAVALRVRERRLPDRRHPRWKRLRRELDLVERPGVQAVSSSVSSS